MNDHENNKKKYEIVSYNYQNTVKIKYWENYLGRKLEHEEVFILRHAESEKKLNDKIVKIYELAKTHGLCIPELTNMHGNCLFESLQYHELCDDVDEFRCGLAFLMIMFKDKKDFIPLFKGESMDDLFKQFSDQDTVVFCRKKRRAYKYNFVAMCIDLATNSSWTRVNTHIVLSAICSLLDIKIQIFHNNGHISTISVSDKPSQNTIYLGLIDEIHYFPLVEIVEMVEKNNNTGNICPKYVDNLKLFHQWAKGVALTTGNVTYEHEVL